MDTQAREDDCIDDIHRYWFGTLADDGMPQEDLQSLWFTASAATDATCRRRFGASLEQALRGELSHWADCDRGLVALVVLLDQFSRNIHRGSPRAFAGDPQALALSRDSIARGRHRSLPTIHRVFLYLPLEHSEDLAVQRESVALFQQLDQSDARLAGFTRYALAHRDVIARFGRFPHRNAILGRASSAAELAYLERHGGF